MRYLQEPITLLVSYKPHGHQLRSQGLPSSLHLAQAGHVSPRIWEMTIIEGRGGLVRILSILSLREWNDMMFLVIFCKRWSKRIHRQVAVDCVVQSRTLQILKISLKKANKEFFCKEFKVLLCKRHFLGSLYLLWGVVFRSTLPWQFTNNR